MKKQENTLRRHYDRACNSFEPNPFKPHQCRRCYRVEQVHKSGNNTIEWMLTTSTSTAVIDSPRDEQACLKSMEQTAQEIESLSLDEIVDQFYYNCKGHLCHLYEKQLPFIAPNSAVANTLLSLTDEYVLERLEQDHEMKSRSNSVWLSTPRVFSNKFHVVLITNPLTKYDTLLTPSLCFSASVVQTSILGLCSSLLHNGVDVLFFPSQVTHCIYDYEALGRFQALCLTILSTCPLDSSRLQRWIASSSKASIQYQYCYLDGKEWKLETDSSYSSYSFSSSQTALLAASKCVPRLLFPFIQ